MTSPRFSPFAGPPRSRLGVLAARRRRFARRILVPGATLVAATVLAAVLVKAGLLFLANLPLFRVDEVRVGGLSYLTEDQVRVAAGVDGTTSLWGAEAAWLKGIEALPMVKSVEVRRRLPATLIFTVREATPVALVASPLVIPVDGGGNPLPVDPTGPVLDLPLLRVLQPDSSPSRGIGVLAREAERLGEMAPDVFAVISEMHLTEERVIIFLGDSALKLRYIPPISERRIREAIVAMNDALQRFPDQPLREVDLRFEDQVVVRTTASAGEVIP